jgi:hypothetical protein
MVLLQPQEFDAPVLGLPRLGVRPPSDLVATDVVFHQRHRPWQPQLRLLQRRLQESHRPIQRQLRSLTLKPPPYQGHEQMGEPHERHVMMPTDPRPRLVLRHP